MFKIIGIFVSGFLWCQGLAGLNAQDLKALQTPPADSADAENLRIWYSIERKSYCQFTLEIYTLSQKKIRQLLNQPLNAGYYNFYWDKKDDSGRYVVPGTYLYKLVDCSKIKYGNLKVAYRKGENTSSFYPDSTGENFKVGFELLEDSARVSLRIYNNVEVLKEEPIVDSLMFGGRYSYTWHPEEKINPGIYIFRLQVDDYSRDLKFSYP